MLQVSNSWCVLQVSNSWCVLQVSNSWCVSQGSNSWCVSQGSNSWCVSQVEWEHSYEELTVPPCLTPRGLLLTVRLERKRLLGVFGGGSNSKEVNCNVNSPHCKVRLG